MRIIKKERIEEYMKENNLSATKFCKLCNISPAVLKKIRKDKINYRINALFWIAKVMKVHVATLFYN